MELGEKWLDLGCILKMELTIFADELGVRKGRPKQLYGAMY